jgi:hypothetical protein
LQWRVTQERAYHLEERGALRGGREKRSARAQGALQVPVKISIAGGAPHQLREPGLIAKREVTWIRATEHAEVAGHAGREHRRADAGGLGDDVGAALHHRAHHQRMAASDPAERARMRQAAEPAVARLARHPVAGFLPERRVQRAADVYHLHSFFFFFRKAGEGEDGAQGIFLLAQMPDHRHAKTVARGRGPQRAAARLVNHPGFFSHRRGKLGQRRLLQHDHPVRELERAARLDRGRQVAVEIGPSEGYDQRRVGSFLELQDRGMAAAGMQGDQNVAALAFPGEAHRHAMPGAAQHRRPARRGVAVAVAGARPGRRDDVDARHDLDLNVRC